jgi:hypothetical protein
MAVLLPAGSGRRKEVIPQRLTVDQGEGHSSTNPIFYKELNHDSDPRKPYYR